LNPLTAAHHGGSNPEMTKVAMAQGRKCLELEATEQVGVSRKSVKQGVTKIR
jgi:hypothetical protein